MIRIFVGPETIDIGAEMTIAESASGAGAIATFTGLVRADDGVGTLELEHYPGAISPTRWTIVAAASDQRTIAPSAMLRRAASVAPG
jgi:molybdopterin synthase catalytic subunit